MNKESKEYRSNLDILEKHLGKNYYKIGHLHVMISQAMDEAVLNKSSDISPVMSAKRTYSSEDMINAYRQGALNRSAGIFRNPQTWLDEYATYINKTDGKNT